MPGLKRDGVYTHSADGGLYRLNGLNVLGKDDATGLWVPGVTYEDIDPRSHRFAQGYWTSEGRFRDKFALVDLGLHLLPPASIGGPAPPATKRRWRP